MVKGVIFDFDGLIADTEYISYESYRDFLQTYHIPFTKQDYITYCPGKQLIVSMEFFKEHYHLDMNIEEACQFFHEREYYYMEHAGVALKKGVCELLDYLKNKEIPICLATSSLQKRASNILESHHLMSYFDAFVFGGEVKRGKPYPDVFLKACEKINVNVKEALVLEDSEAGIKAAYLGNIPVICIPDMKQPDQKYQDMCQAVYPDLTYVIKYIELEK